MKFETQYCWYCNLEFGVGYKKPKKKACPKCGTPFPRSITEKNYD